MRITGERPRAIDGTRARRAPRTAFLALASTAAALAAAVSSAPGAPTRGEIRSAARVDPSAVQEQRPAVTLLYQNFPNPFPTVDSRTTCIWFDLDRITTVTLTIHDVRGNLVRRLLPVAVGAPPLSPGRYGRASPSSGTGCDPALTWDGRADDGKLVPRGVYLIRLRAAGTESIKKALFQGP